MEIHTTGNRNNRFIDVLRDLIDYRYEIFALSHPGFMGTSNRKRYTKNISLKKLSALDILRND